MEEEQSITLMKAWHAFSTHCSESRLPAGRERAQMWDLWARVHPAGQHEETRADPHQHPRLPVSPLLQELCAEADAQGAHDRPLRREAFQMQGGKKGGLGGGAMQM